MQTNRFLLTVLKIGLGILLFTPLLVSNSMFFPFITAKNFFFRIVVEILLALWIILILRDKRYVPGSSWVLIFITASTLILALATLFGVDASRSFWSNFERMEGLLGHLHVFAYFLILVGVNKTEKDWWRFFQASFVASIIVSFFALLQMAGAYEIHQGGARIDSTLGNATYLAVYLLFHVFLALYYFLKSKNAFGQIGYAVIMLFEIFLLVQTATRGAVLGMIGGFIIFGIILAITTKDHRLKYFAFGSLALILLLGGGFFMIRDSSFVKESPSLARLSNISSDSDDAQARFHIWNMSLKAFKERPILGWGPENFTVVFSKHYDPRMWAREPWFDRAHNVFFDWLVTTGILGLVAYLGIFASAVWMLIKKYRQNHANNLELSVFIGLLAAFFFQNIFVFDQLTSYILLFAVLGYIHFLYQPDAMARRSEPLVGAGQVTVFSALAAILIVASLYLFNVKPLIANFSLLNALESANAGKFEDAQKSFNRAISTSALGRREAREQYSHFATLLAARTDVPEAIRTSSLTEGIAEAKLETEDSPLDARSHLFLGSIYNAAGRKAEALESFEKALELSPEKQQIIFLVAQFYLDSGQNDKALELAKRGAELDPTYGDAQHNLIAVQILAGKTEDAMASIETLLMKNAAGPENMKAWGSLFAQKQNYPPAVALYKRVLDLNPKDTQTRVSLAAAYYESGNTPGAIAEIRTAIEMDPSFKEQGDQFIKVLQEGKKP